jgi:hypothetical protein
MTAATMTRSAHARPRVAGLAWVTWRQHRVALLGVVALLGFFAVLMIVNGNAMRGDYHRLGLDSCSSTSSALRCNTGLDEFEHRYQGIAQFLPRLVLFIPAILGAFVGAPLVARELETGAFRFAWTQGTNRTRWIVAKLVLLGAALAVLAYAFTVLFTWWFHLWIPIMGRMQTGQAYEIEGTVFVARTVFAFALGACLGAVIRRTVPAMAATLAGWLAVVWPSVVYLRQHIQTPVTAPDTNRVSRQDWLLSQWFQDRAGHHLTDSQVSELLQGAVTKGHRVPLVSLNQVLSAHGVSQWDKYQPASRFWHFQLVESLAYVILTVLLGAVTVWWVRRRAA